MKSTMIPLADRVIIKQHDAEEMTKGGLIIPDQAQQKPHRGTVLVTGPGKTYENGVTRACQVKAGDEVLYAKFAGVEIKFDGEDCIILRESDILAVL